MKNNNELEDTNELEIFPEAELEEINSIEIFSLVSDSRLSFYQTSKLEDLPVVEDICETENPKSIVESESGLFFISKNIDTKAVVIDKDFKNIVDSVLQNDI